MSLTPDGSGASQAATHDTADGTVVNSLGATLHFNSGDRRGRELAAKNGEPYPHSLGLWQRALEIAPHWDHVIDVGANYGEMLAGVALPDDAQVSAFEPNPQVLSYLRRTLDGLPLVVHLEAAAVGDVTADQVELSVNVEWSGESHLSAVASPAENPDDYSVAAVRQTTLDDFLGAAPGAVCVKIDVEGFELQVLAGARKTLEEAELVVLMIEILHMPVQEVLALSRRFPLYLFHIERQELVRWDGADGYQLGRALHAGDIYRQDAILLAGRTAQEVDAMLAETVDSTRAMDARIKDAWTQRAAELDASLRSAAVVRRRVGAAYKVLAERLKRLAESNG